MLTILADAMLTATRRKTWDAPDHWGNHHTRRTNAQLEREAAERRHRQFRDIGMW